MRSQHSATIKPLSGNVRVRQPTTYSRVIRTDFRISPTVAATTKNVRVVAFRVCVLVGESAAVWVTVSARRPATCIGNGCAANARQSIYRRSRHERRYATWRVGFELPADYDDRGDLGRWNRQLGRGATGPSRRTLSQQRAPLAHRPRPTQPDDLVLLLKSLSSRFARETQTQAIAVAPATPNDGASQARGAALLSPLKCENCMAPPPQSRCCSRDTARR